MRRATPLSAVKNKTLSIFLSTPSVRRATPPFLRMDGSTSISIHALREEGDSGTCSRTRQTSLFLSTPSVRRATRSGALCAANHAISIHALREEGDLDPEHRENYDSIISIHALREEGDVWMVNTFALEPKFLSTPSARRATKQGAMARRGVAFLSTPSARRATDRCPDTAVCACYFYPRPPRGGRPKQSKGAVLR